MNMFFRLLLLTILMTAQEAVQAQTRNVYSRCSACHLANGAGVPGAFPSLRADVRNLARSEAGRKYLILVVLKGVSGPIEVDGKSYKGIMPAQTGLDDAAVAVVLNFAANELNKSGAAPRAFNANEIAGIRKAFGNLTPAQVAKLRPKI